MKYINKLFIFLLLFTAVFTSISAQTSDGRIRQGQSIIRGLRIPVFTTAQRDSISVSGQKFTRGQVIFNYDTNLQEYWDGTRWVSSGGNPWYMADTNRPANSVGESIYHLGPVTIGDSVVSARGAFMDYKETEATNPTENVASLENATKGVLYPKVFLRDAAKLTPLYGGTDNGSGVWSDDSSAEEKLKATGMIVYNVNPDAVNMDDGLYMWQISEWVKLNQDGAAIIQPVDCSDIRVNGSYVAQTPLNDSHYLEIVLNVTKKGSFYISVLSGNGYAFYYTGIALETGKITVKVPAQGTPAAAQTDRLIFSGIGLVSGCEPEITVQDRVAVYTMLCSSVTVQGQYYKNEALTSAHTIRMNINVSQTGSYDIYTVTKNGISFRATGEFTTTGTHIVTLAGTGAPTINEDFEVAIIANTKLGSVECSALIPIILPDMTYAVIGAIDGIWSWDNPARRAALSATNSGSFSVNGRVKIRSFTRLWVTADVNIAAGYLNNGYGGKQPDVVLYFAYGALPNATITTALVNYINKGGGVVYGSYDDTESSVSAMLQGIFGSTITAEGRAIDRLDDQVYMIANNASDPVINGPFGNLAGQHWGEDNDHAGGVVTPVLPPNSVQVCSAQPVSDPSSNPNYSIVWYSNDKNFVYMGDSVGGTSTDTSTGGYPALYVSNLPVSKLYGPGSPNNRYVYNSALEMNAVSFLIKKAAVSGINPH